MPFRKWGAGAPAEPEVRGGPARTTEPVGPSRTRRPPGTACESLPAVLRHRPAARPLEDAQPPQSHRHGDTTLAGVPESLEALFASRTALPVVGVSGVRARYGRCVAPHSAGSALFGLFRASSRI